MAAARRKRPRPRPAEIAAAVAVVLAGVGLIAAIVLLDPRWQRIIASQGDGVAVGPPPAIAPVASETQAAPDATATSAAPAAVGVAAPPVQARPARVESTPVTITAAPPPSDMTQVMASLLVSQLGFDLAWRTAAANAEGHAAGTPEHTYWSGVMAAIRGGHRPQP